MSKYEIGGSAGMKMREGSNSDKKGCLSTRAKFMLLGLLIITLISVIVVLAILIAYKDKVGVKHIMHQPFFTLLWCDYRPFDHLCCSRSL